MNIKIHKLPKKGDVLTNQFFGNGAEIRANMIKTTGTGTLLASYSCADTMSKTTADRISKELLEIRAFFDKAIA